MNLAEKRKIAEKHSDMLLEQYRELIPVLPKTLEERKKIISSKVLFKPTGRIKKDRGFIRRQKNTKYQSDRIRAEDMADELLGFNCYEKKIQNYKSINRKQKLVRKLIKKNLNTPLVRLKISLICSLLRVFNFKAGDLERNRIALQEFKEYKRQEKLQTNDVYNKQ